MNDNSQGGPNVRCPTQKEKRGRPAAFPRSYMKLAKGEGIPIHLDFGHDLLALKTEPWARYDARGCFAHTHGRGDFLRQYYVLEIEAARKHGQSNIYYEAFFFVLSDMFNNADPAGWGKQTFEWGRRPCSAYR